MTRLNSFDHIAALSPDLRAAIDEGRVNPHRWILQQNKLIDSATGTMLYDEDKPDAEVENEAVNQWLKQAECLQIADTATLKSLIAENACTWRSLGHGKLANLNLANIHDSAKDLQLLWSCQQIHEFLDQHHINLLESPRRHDNGLLLIHGMGSCTEIARLVVATQPRLILLFETDIDLLAKRVGDRIEAEQLLLAIQSTECTLYFITDKDGDKAMHYANHLIAMTSLRAQSYCFSFRFRTTALTADLDKRLTSPDAYLKTLRYLGFFVDELHMLMNSILTFAHTDTHILSYGTIKEHQRHAVIVGSGPSLAAALPLLKAERERFDVICSFSTIGPLLKAGITPDYHCHMERHADARFIQESPELEAFSRNATLLTSANVDPRFAQLYQNKFAFLRSASSTSALMASRFSEIIGAEGSEAANAAIVFAVLLGYRTLHLFGVDFGAVEPSKSDRIEGALHVSPRKMNQTAEGNLRPTVWTSQFLKDAAEWVGIFLNPDLYEPSRSSVEKTKVYNYSDGQMIPRTVRAKPYTFNENLKNSIAMDCIQMAIRQSAETDQQRHSRERLLGCDLGGRIQLECKIMRQLATLPLNDRNYDLFRQCCSDRNTNMLNDQVTSRLFGGSLSRIWIYLLVLGRIMPEEAVAAWDEKCREILLECINSMEFLSLNMIQYVLTLDCLANHKLRSVLEEKEALEQI